MLKVKDLLQTYNGNIDYICLINNNTLDSRIFNFPITENSKDLIIKNKLLDLFDDDNVFSFGTDSQGFYIEIITDITFPQLYQKEIEFEDELNEQRVA